MGLMTPHVILKSPWSHHCVLVKSYKNNVFACSCSLILVFLPHDIPWSPHWPQDFLAWVRVAFGSASGVSLAFEASALNGKIWGKASIDGCFNIFNGKIHQQNMIKWRFIAENIIEVLNYFGWTLQPRVDDWPVKSTNNLIPLSFNSHILYTPIKNM